MFNEKCGGHLLLRSNETTLTPITMSHWLLYETIALFDGWSYRHGLDGFIGFTEVEHAAALNGSIAFYGGSIETHLMDSPM